MIEKQINRKYLKTFLNNLRKEDFEEVCVFDTDDLIQEILNVANNPINETYFLMTNENNPLAIGGACSVQNSKYKTAKVWLLVTNELSSSKKSLLKYVLNKANSFKNKYDILFNFIYKSNYNSLKWLKKAGFKVLNFNNDYKLFYFIKGDIKFDLRYFTS